MINARTVGLLLSLLFLGCPAAPLPEPGAHTRNDPATQRFNSFGFVKIMNTGRHVDCQVLQTQSPCSDATIDALRPITVNMTGSSMVVAHARGRSYILTADHVCATPDLPDVSVFPEDRKVIMTQVAWDTRRVVIDIEGTMHDARPVITDEHNDICVMEVDGVWGSPVPLAPRPLGMGDRAYNIAAPSGIFDAGMVPIFIGIYSGTSSNISNTQVMSSPYSEVPFSDLYTFPSRPGSSGSAVLNQAGEIVGVIHSTVATVPGLSISSTWEAVRDIFRRLNRFISDRG